MASIFSLYGEVFVDNEKATKSIKDVKDSAENTSKSFRERFGDIAKTAAKVGTAIVTTSAAAVTGLTAMANKTAVAADEIDKGSIRMGISTKSYQELKYAAGQCGVELTSLEKAAKKLEGTDMNMDDAMKSIMSLSTAEERASKAAELFGDNIAYTLSPLIEQNTDDYDALIQRANDLGIVMSEDAVKAGVKFGDTMSDVQQAFGGIFNSLSSAVIPVIQVVLDLIIENMPLIQSLIGSLAPILSDLLSGLLPPLIQLAKTIFPVIVNLFNQLMPFFTKVVQAILPVIISLLDMLLPPIMQIVELILPILIQLIEPLLPLLEPIFNLLQPFIDLLMALLEPLLQLLNLILPPLIKLFTAIIQTILPPLQLALSAVAGVLTGAFGGALTYIKNQLQVVINVFNNIISFVKNVFTGNWKAAWENVKNIFANIAQGIGNVFKAPINFIIDAINVFIKGLNKIKIPDWVPAVGGKGFNISLLKKLRVGMDYVPYDDMPALLHKGEAVLTADENKEYQANKNKTDETTNIVYNNSITVEKLEVRDDSDIEKIAQELYYLQKKEVGA